MPIVFSNVRLCPTAYHLFTIGFTYVLETFYGIVWPVYLFLVNQSRENSGRI